MRDASIDLRPAPPTLRRRRRPSAKKKAFGRKKKQRWGDDESVRAEHLPTAATDGYLTTHKKYTA